MSNGFKSLAVLLLGLFSFVAIASTADKTSDFLNRSFANDVPPAQTVWLTGETGKKIADILQHPVTSLRTRYWLKDDRSAWIMNEIGKERPITIGIIIDGMAIKSIEILAYRESRGGEVQLQSFRQQFENATLNNKLQLSQNIDGITGATLSVRAVKKVAKIALLLHNKVTHAQSTNSP